ncbi:MAG: SlyX family protein [Gammaproteobacteria bacterium]|nr:SlyX family protein [Gammaproteobacteria bacterium]
MTSDIDKKLRNLESLYSEQEYTVMTLNNIVSRQDQEISRLGDELQWIKRQLLTLKEQLPNDTTSLSDEKPPHY